MTEGRTGRVLTFYSYKGGTGRSMALANVACLLARRLPPGGRVLCLDWDLEAPGLHRFLMSNEEPVDGLYEDEVERSDPGHEGVIDLFWKLKDALDGEKCQEGDLFEHVRVDDYVVGTPQKPEKSVFMMQAGLFDEGYATKYRSFDWQALLDQAPSVFRNLAAELTKRYDYVLIDSRTGITDVSGICTAIMPDGLVAVFTPNRQSICGITNVIRRAIRYRGQSEDLRPLLVYPVVSRVETAESDKYEWWRHGRSDRGTIGYQKVFQDLLEASYDLSECNLAKYFSKIQIPHVPYYGFGESIAVNRENGEDLRSLSYAYVLLANCLAAEAEPWDPRIEAIAYGTTPSTVVPRELAPTFCIFSGRKYVARADDHNCTQCGRPLSAHRPIKGGQMKCRKCEKENDDKALYCASCGTRLKPNRLLIFASVLGGAAMIVAVVALLSFILARSDLRSGYYHFGYRCDSLEHLMGSLNLKLDSIGGFLDDPKSRFGSFRGPAQDTSPARSSGTRGSRKQPTAAPRRDTFKISGPPLMWMH